MMSKALWKHVKHRRRRCRRLQHSHRGRLALSQSSQQWLDRLQMHKETVDLGCMQWLIHQCHIHPGAPSEAWTSSVHMLASSGNTLSLSLRCSFLFHVSVYFNTK